MESIAYFDGTGPAVSMSTEMKHSGASLWFLAVMAFRDYGLPERRHSRQAESGAASPQVEQVTQ
ncbi:hypothetical protein GCM10027448_00840 [Nocardioides dilutus]